MERTYIPAMIALVEAIAGMIFFTTPCVNDHVMPSILNSFALSRATSYSHWMCSGLSVSSFVSARGRLELHLAAVMSVTRTSFHLRPF